MRRKRQVLTPEQLRRRNRRLARKLAEQERLAKGIPVFCTNCGQITKVIVKGRPVDSVWEFTRFSVILHRGARITRPSIRRVKWCPHCYCKVERLSKAA